MSSSLNLVWWIALGLLVFWVMRRVGCGGMMSRGRSHGHDPASRTGGGKPVDPVCGMEVDPAKAAGTRVSEGETYFFCSQTCADAFDRDAAMYAHREQRSQQHRHSGCC
jgi:YHS domain-containing protein